MSRVPILWAVFLSVSLSGCFYHTVEIGVAPTSAEQAPLSQAEVSQTMKIVDEIAGRRGLDVNPDIEILRRESREEDIWSHVVHSSYRPGSSAETDHRVVLSLQQSKTTGELRILIRDLDSPASTEFTSSLKESIELALTEAFPSRSILVAQKAVGPALSP